MESIRLAHQYIIDARNAGFQPDGMEMCRLLTKIEGEVERDYVKRCIGCYAKGVYIYGERDEKRALSMKCGYEFDWDAVDLPNYCPGCGHPFIGGEQG